MFYTCFTFLSLGHLASESLSDTSNNSYPISSLQCCSLYSTSQSQEDKEGQFNTSQEHPKLTAKDLKRQRIALIVGPAWFLVLIYLCFIRDEKEGDIIMDYLSQDPRYNDKLPEEVRRKAKQLYGDSDIK